MNNTPLEVSKETDMQRDAAEVLEHVIISFENLAQILNFWKE